MRQGLRRRDPAGRPGARDRPAARFEPGEEAGARLQGRVREGVRRGSLATFGGHAWDAGLLLQRAIPEALKKGQPGTEAFREALRASIENVKDLPVSHGVINMTPTDHNGFDTRARVMVQIVDGKWKLQAE